MKRIVLVGLLVVVGFAAYFVIRAVRPVRMSQTVKKPEPVQATPTEAIDSVMFSTGIVPTKVSTSVDVFASLIGKKVDPKSVKLFEVSDTGELKFISALEDSGMELGLGAAEGVFRTTIHINAERDVKYRVSAVLEKDSSTIYSKDLVVKVTPGTVIDAKGGSFTSSDGISISFPPGALEGSARFAAAKIEKNMYPFFKPERLPVYSAVEIMPILGRVEKAPWGKNLSFQVKVPLIEPATPGTVYQVLTINDSNSDFAQANSRQTVGTNVDATVDETGRMAVFTLGQFGIFFLIKLDELINL